jgi:hypothetical protein
VRNHDIIVSNGVGLSLTYRKQGRILEAPEPMRLGSIQPTMLMSTLSSWSNKLKSTLSMS